MRKAAFLSQFTTKNDLYVAKDSWQAMLAIYSSKFELNFTAIYARNCNSIPYLVINFNVFLLFLIDLLHHLVHS